MSILILIVLFLFFYLIINISVVKEELNYIYLEREETI